MSGFSHLNLNKFLVSAIEDLGFTSQTPVQEKSFPVILSGKDMIGIAQTGTGKTFAYGLPLLHQLKFAQQTHPRILILVPTRELVIQVVEMLSEISKYINHRILGVYGGTNINNQRQAVRQGCDILVATPGRLYDLALDHTVNLKQIGKLVIDEVDVMLDLGFRFQLTNIFELLPVKRQNIMFSATMTEEVEVLIEDFFLNPTQVSIAVSGTPLKNIQQKAYPAKNFYTKFNLLKHLLKQHQEMKKVLIFVDNKKSADLLYETMGESGFGSKTGVIHSNKSQNQRLRAIDEFEEGKIKYLVATDLMARGLDIDNISHVLNYDTPQYPENYMHRIGRTGRAEEKGNSILFYTPTEAEFKKGIENLMKIEIDTLPFPEIVQVSTMLTPEEKPKISKEGSTHKIQRAQAVGDAYHEKLEKNKKINLEPAHLRAKAEKYKKPKTRGDKKSNQRNNKK
ncbi:MAG: ATP-dependent RNA helicase RhlE [Luteibaculaceae bacterium]|jgi:ATP-dependent RNA helicase RhlE